jgi:hypothetical protein
LNQAIFVSDEVIVSRLGVQDGQKCPLKDSNVTAIMLTAPCRVSGDHPSLTLFATILLHLVSPPLHAGWETALFAGKYPHVHLVPLNVGFTSHGRKFLELEVLMQKSSRTSACQSRKGPFRTSGVMEKNNWLRVFCSARASHIGQNRRQQRHTRVMWQEWRRCRSMRAMSDQRVSHGLRSHRYAVTAQSMPGLGCCQ